MTIRGGRRGEGKEGKRMSGVTKLKTNVNSAATEKKQCLGEACLAAWNQEGRGSTAECGMTSLLNVCDCVLAKSRDAQYSQGRGAERTGWILWGNQFL